MKTIASTELARFILLTTAAQYNEEKKEEYRKLGRKILQAVASQLGLISGEYDIRWNPGGIACSGDHTLHTDRFYLALHDNVGTGWFYYRTCKGRKDYTGGQNQIVAWETLQTYGIEFLVDRLKRIQFVPTD